MNLFSHETRSTCNIILGVHATEMRSTPDGYDDFDLGGESKEDMKKATQTPMIDDVVDF